MKKNFYDLHVSLEAGDISEVVETAEKLGWKGICLTQPFNQKFEMFAKKVSELKKSYPLEIFIGAEIKKEIRKQARKALHYSDMVLVEGGRSKVNREASECWEVDILCHPEKEEGKKKKHDYIHQKNSGLDHIIAKRLSEKFIGLEINFFQILNSSGFSRALRLGRIRQNILLARKFNIPLIITSGAKDIFSLRAPLDLKATGESLGLTPQEAKQALTKNPQYIIKKFKDRKNPNILLKGLEVLDFGKQERKPKKMYGWY